MAIGTTLVPVQPAVGAGNNIIESGGYRPIGGNTQQLFEGAQRLFGIDTYPNKNVYLQKVLYVSKLMEDVRNGRRNAGAALLEAFSSSDFEYLFDDVLNRSLLGAYELWTVDYQAYMERRMVRDFRQNYIFRRDGLRSKLPERDELGTYEEDNMEDNRYVFEMKEYAKGIKISWRTYINDDLDALARVPNDLADAIRWTESDLASRMYLKSGGYHDFFHGGSTYGTRATTDETFRLHQPSLGNVNTRGGVNVDDDQVIRNVLRANTSYGTSDNARLTPSALVAAKTQMRKQLGYNGEPIRIMGMHLVCGISLYEIANSILKATTIVSERMGGRRASTTESEVYSGFERIGHNTAAEGVQIHLDPNFDSIVGGSLADTMWFLIADPVSSARPAFVYSKLQGYESPRMFKERSKWELVGGGGSSEDPMYSSYLCQMFFGTAHIDPRFVLVSKGDDSNV